MQILRSTPATLELLVYQAGELTDLDANPTVAVTDGDGANVAVGTVTKPAGTTGTYRAVLDGQDDLTLLKAVWSGQLSSKAVKFTRRYEIVGNLLFLEAEARTKTITGDQTPISDENTYPDSDIARVRAMICDRFEQRTGRAWIRRYTRCELAGTGGQLLDLARGNHRSADGTRAGREGRLRDVATIISASIGGTAVDLTDLVLDGKRIIRTNGTWTRPSISDPLNVVVEYEYGPDPVPYEANEQGLRMALHNLVPSDVSGYAQTFASPDGTITFGRGGLAYPTETWEWLKQHKPVLIG